MADLYSTWDDTYQGNTTVLEYDREYLVKYRDEYGEEFRLIFRVKPNPIGFIWRKS